MASTLEELEKRVVRLEIELQEIKNSNEGDDKEAWDELFAELGIQGEPIPAEKLQQMIGDNLRKQGINPEDNIFSREIIAMREE